VSEQAGGTMVFHSGSAERLGLDTGVQTELIEDVSVEVESNSGGGENIAAASHGKG
jgi:hypothetical protein